MSQVDPLIIKANKEGWTDEQLQKALRERASGGRQPVPPFSIAGMLGAIGQALSRRSSPYRNPGDGTTGIDGELSPINPVPGVTVPPAKQPEPQLIGMPRVTPQEWQTAQGGVDDALRRTQEEAPKLRSPAPTKEEGIAAALIGLIGHKNPAFLARALQAPRELATERANLENADAQNAYGSRIRAANTQLGAAQKQIGLLQTRDEVAARIEGQVRQTQMRESTKLFIAEAKSDQVLMTALAKVLENGGSLPAIETLLMQRNDQMGIVEDSETTRARAQALYEAAQSDPSMKNRIASAAQQTKANALTETQRKNARAMLLNPNATFDARLDAIMTLGELGDPRFGQMTFDQMQASAATRGSTTQRNEAQTKQITELLPYRIQEFKDKHGLSTARAEYIAKQTSLMDEESAVKVAQGYASIDNMRSQIGDREADRELGYAKLRTDQLIRSQDGLKTMLTTLSSQANTLRGRLQSQLKALSVAEDDEEKARIQEDITGIELAIKNYKIMYGEASEELKKIRGALGSEVQDSETGNPGDKPANPFRGPVDSGKGGPDPTKPKGKSKGYKKGETKTFEGGVKVTRIS